MKDLILTKNDTSLVGRLRVDMLSNNPANITIMEMYNSNGKSVDSIDLIGGFYKKLSYSWATFKAFCVANNIAILARDTNGNNSSVLLQNQAPAGTKYPIVSINGGTKTISIATDVTSDFSADNELVIYNPDNTIFGTFTHVSDSYSAPNTLIVVSETIATVATNSGKYLVIAD